MNVLRSLKLAQMSGSMREGAIATRPLNPPLPPGAKNLPVQ